VNELRKIKIKTYIDAPIDKCFQTAQNLDIYLDSIPKLKRLEIESDQERNFQIGDKVYWAFYLYKDFLSIDVETTITQFIQGQKITEEIESILFKEFRHTHQFFEREEGTLMVETIDYDLSFGVIGSLLHHFFLEDFIKKFILKRKRTIQRQAEK